MTADPRVEKAILELIDEDFSQEEIPELVAHTLVDEDVSSGEYEGCSVELEIAYTSYVARAEQALA